MRTNLKLSENNEIICIPFPIVREGTAGIIWIAQSFTGEEAKQVFNLNKMFPASSAPWRILSEQLSTARKKVSR